MPWILIDVAAISGDQYDALIRVLPQKSGKLDLSDAEVSTIKQALRASVERNQDARKACYDSNGAFKLADALVANYGTVAQLFADNEHAAAAILAQLDGAEMPERVIVEAAPAPEHRTAVQRQKRPHKKNYAREGQNKLRAEP